MKLDNLKLVNEAADNLAYARSAIRGVHAYVGCENMPVRGFGVSTPNAIPAEQHSKAICLAGIRLADAVKESLRQYEEDMLAVLDGLGVVYEQD